MNIKDALMILLKYYNVSGEKKIHFDDNAE